MGTTAYLDEESEQRARMIQEAEGFKSLSAAVQYSLRELEKKYRENRLAEKYRREEPVSPAATRAQEETLSDLDD